MSERATENTVRIPHTFYRLTSDGIDVIRVLDERMDPERHIP